MKKSILLFTAVLAYQVSFSQTKCTCKVANASYTGLYKGVENNLTVEDLATDMNCANKFKNEKYPNGFLTIFGSSRINEKNNGDNQEINKANDKLYKEIKQFAFDWTKKYSKYYPIMTGAGPGIMEAGSRGAKEAGGPSIGYTTYYASSRNDSNGNQSEAFWKYQSKHDIITDGLIFTSVAIREYAMIMHSSIMVFAPGGTGTEWEIFQTIEKMKSGQLNIIPIYIVGKKEIHWKSFYQRLYDMVKRGTIKRHEVESLIVHVDSASYLMKVIEKKMKLQKCLTFYRTE